MIKVRKEKPLDRNNWLDDAVVVVGSNTYQVKYTGISKQYKVQLLAGKSNDNNIYQYSEETLIRDSSLNGWYLVTKNNRIVVSDRKIHDPWCNW